MVRFICGVILHMQLQGELRAGMNTMKFSLNHPYRFSDYKIVFLTGLLQASMIFIVEIVNFIVILSSFSITGVVTDFMALAVISEFDDAFFEALGDDKNKTVIEEADKFEPLFKITRTTSHAARSDHPTHILDDDTMGEYTNVKIRVAFSERTTFNKVLRLIYKLIRTIYVSVWFYFLPFIALIGSYVVPYLLQERQKHAAEILTITI